MSLIAWNINGLSPDKLFLHDTEAFLTTYDIVVLSETRSSVLPDHFLQSYDVTFNPSPSHGTAGMGLLVAVRRCLHVSVSTFACDASTLWVKLMSPSMSRPLIVCACYIPPQGSCQLVQHSASTRFESLTLNILSASAVADIIVAGDFNARVADSPDADYTVVAPREMTDEVLSSHGRHLVQMCQGSQTYLLTGRTPGDELATPSYRARQGTQPSRLDHALVSLQNHCKIISAEILSDRSDSDHFPLQVIIDLPSIRGSQYDVNGTYIQRVQWDLSSQLSYARALHAFELGGGTTSAQTEALFTQIRQAAVAAKMSLKKHCTNRRPNKPFYDERCVQLKRAFRACCRQKGTPQQMKELERQYHTYARRCRRAFEAKNLAQLLQEKHGNPRKFWKTLRRPTMTLPVRLQDVSAWDNYIQKLASPALPHDCILPLEAYPQMDASKAVGLNAAISSCEVENHLKRLHNGKAVSISGLPSELLRYAVMPSSPAEPHPQHILLPHLLQLLNCFFYTGNLPSQLCTAVITPVYKKGCKEDCSNYRPIAVTEPLLQALCWDPQHQAAGLHRKPKS